MKCYVNFSSQHFISEPSSRLTDRHTLCLSNSGVARFSFSKVRQAFQTFGTSTLSTILAVVQIQTHRYHTKAFDAMRELTWYLGHFCSVKGSTKAKRIGGGEEDFDGGAQPKKKRRSRGRYAAHTGMSTKAKQIAAAAAISVGVIVGTVCFLIVDEGDRISALSAKAEAAMETNSKKRHKPKKPRTKKKYKRRH